MCKTALCTIPHLGEWGGGASDNSCVCVMPFIMKVLRVSPAKSGIFPCEANWMLVTSHVFPCMEATMTGIFPLSNKYLYSIITNLFYAAFA